MATQSKSMNVDLNSVLGGAASQFRGLNSREPGQWPLLPKLLAWTGVGVAAVVIGWFALLSSAHDELEAERNKERNTLRRAKKDMDNLEGSIEKLKAQATELEASMSQKSNGGWSVLAELTEKLQKVNEQIEEKEIQWMELAEQLEEASEVEA